MTDALHHLLEVQDLDVAADQLRYRRASLPEQAALKKAQAGLADCESGLVELNLDLTSRRVSQRKAESDLEVLAARVTAEERRLYGGSVTAMREVEAVQSELAAIARRQGQLEDELLADMESIDELVGMVAESERERSQLEHDAAALIGAVGLAEATIDAELSAAVEARAALVDGLPADLLATYERLRARFNGVAIARLEGGHCMGCHLALAATEVAALRRSADGSFVTHEECGRILVP